jgi:hypothetical protein
MSLSSDRSPLVIVLISTPAPQRDFGVGHLVGITVIQSYSHTVISTIGAANARP